PGTLQEGGASFQTTHWTVVFRAGEPDSETSSHQALSGFCEAYWPPLYSFLRHRGHSSADAQDLVQGFFVRLLEQNTLSRADRQKGRLRTFLLGSLENFLYNEYDRARALKRGGRSEEHTSELQSRFDLVCRLLLEKKKKHNKLSSLEEEALKQQKGKHETHNGQ